MPAPVELRVLALIDASIFHHIPSKAMSFLVSIDLSMILMIILMPAMVYFNVLVDKIKVFHLGPIEVVWS